MDIKIYSASRIYNNKCKIYFCSITFKIDDKLQKIDYTSKDENLHYFFCNMIDNNSINNTNILTLLTSIFLRLGLNVFKTGRSNGKDVLNNEIR